MWGISGRCGQGDECPREAAAPPPVACEIVSVLAEIDRARHVSIEESGMLNETLPGLHAIAFRVTASFIRLGDHSSRR